MGRRHDMERQVCRRTTHSKDAHDVNLRLRERGIGSFGREAWLKWLHRLNRNLRSLGETRNATCSYGEVTAG